MIDSWGLKMVGNAVDEVGPTITTIGLDTVVG